MNTATTGLRVSAAVDPRQSAFGDEKKRWVRRRRASAAQGVPTTYSLLKRILEKLVVLREVLVLHLDCCELLLQIHNLDTRFMRRTKGINEACQPALSAALWPRKIIHAVERGVATSSVRAREVIGMRGHATTAVLCKPFKVTYAPGLLYASVPTGGKEGDTLT